MEPSVSSTPFAAAPAALEPPATPGLMTLPPCVTALPQGPEPRSRLHPDLAANSFYHLTAAICSSLDSSLWLLQNSDQNEPSALDLLHSQIRFLQAQALHLISCNLPQTNTTPEQSFHSQTTPPPVLPHTNKQKTTETEHQVPPTVPSPLHCQNIQPSPRLAQIHKPTQLPQAQQTPNRHSLPSEQRSNSSNKPTEPPGTQTAFTASRLKTPPNGYLSIRLISSVL